MKVSPLLLLFFLLQEGLHKMILTDGARKLVQEKKGYSPAPRTLFQLIGSTKGKDIFKLKKKLKEINEEIKQTQKDSESLTDMKAKIQRVLDKVAKVTEDISTRVDMAKSKIVSMGYSGN